MSRPPRRRKPAELAPPATVPTCALAPLELLPTPAHQSWADLHAPAGGPVVVVWDGAFGASPEAWLRHHLSARGLSVGATVYDPTTGRATAPVTRRT